MTKLEITVLDCIKHETAQCEMGYGPTLAMIEERTGLEINVIKGVLGSLEKKALMTIDEGQDGAPACYTALPDFQQAIEVTPYVRVALFRIGRGVEVSTTNALTQGTTPFALHELMKHGHAVKVDDGHQVRLTLEGFELAEREALALTDLHPNWRVIRGEIRRNHVIAQRRAGINIEYETPQRS